MAGDDAKNKTDSNNSKTTGLYDNVTILQEQINSLTERLGRIATLHTIGPRFTDMEDGTILDNDTGVIWLKKANCFEPMNWSDAKAAAASLDWTMCGLDDFSDPGDWRLPTKAEWKAFMSKVYEYPALVNTVGDGQWSEGDAFTGLSREYETIFWSRSEATSGAAYTAGVGGGGILISSHDYPWGVWPVRGGIGPRFTDMGDGTIRDDDSGLIWLKDAKCLGTNNWSGARAAAASLADGQCGLSDGSAARDWRLPTKDEWDAFMTDPLTFYPGPALVDRWGERQWSEGDAFNGVMSVYYWSNTKTPSYMLFYFVADMEFGDISFSQPGASAHVWPVRQ